MEDQPTPTEDEAVRTPEEPEQRATQYPGYVDPELPVAYERVEHEDGR